jgi:predicted DNA-binding protein|tara:strand:+ start:971 stop:1144 length:174 start_codon:yes stop_codon:yes gene_type:complete
MNRKIESERKTEKLSIRLRKEQSERLKRYQKKERLPSKGEAVRRLIEESAGELEPTP